ncbi:MULTISPECIES: amino acid ABC transporter permease [unclassified Aureimonas]|uniref:amino acid ABC transporter permease n=1 Tax=unclassified Aureimonas TaxID=2615206 RepID=UPI0006F2F404|nr:MULTISPECIES: amino acid ABC transporter permease [unclassified Aureimonas]KQT57510.1 amino acid ABC transporter permease [Aureimonas sp. Leaf427]KQT77190.1 amino acid ABC transporter permease [Aureimonas sp. Leaf460]
MEEQVARFVSTEPKLPLPPPAGETGPIARIRKNLFATPVDALLTILAAALIVYVVYHLFEWGIVNAAFTGSDRSVCLPAEGREAGACWAFIGAKFELFMYGIYPEAERWRADLLIILLVALVVPIAIPSVPFKRLNAILLLAVFPFVALVLLTGGDFNLGASGAAFFMLLAAAVTLYVASGKIGFRWEAPLVRLALGLLAVSFVAFVASLVVKTDDVRFLDFELTVAGLVSVGAAIFVVVLTAISTLATPETRGTVLSVLTPFVAIVAVLAFLTSDLGLTPVATNSWGGLLLTLVVAISGIVASLPLGILLALGRRSKMPIVKMFSVIFIEFWRGIPLITVLFMANFMLPLFLPPGVSFDQLLRVLVGVALFSAAYMAEVIRGGLQAIPKGQYEGADAMALTYWQKMRMIILPQALKLVIPGIVNTFIGLFKDTSLVAAVGLADLLGQVRRGFSDQNWATENTPATGLVFAAFVFWLFCFSMSRYSVYMERRLDTGHKR